MKSKEIHEDSWHYHVVKLARKFWFKRDMPDDFCTYFWTCVFSPLLFIVNPVTIGLSILYLVGCVIYTLGGLAVLKGIGSMLLVFAAIFLVVGTVVGVAIGTEHIKKQYCPFISYIPKKKEGQNEHK